MDTNKKSWLRALFAYADGEEKRLALSDRAVGSERHARARAVLLHVPPDLPVCRGRGDGGAGRALVLMVIFGLRAENRSVLPVDRRVARYGLHDLKEPPAASGRPLSACTARQCGKPVDRRNQDDDGRQD